MAVGLSQDGLHSENRKKNTKTTFSSVLGANPSMNRKVVSRKAESPNPEGQYRGMGSARKICTLQIAECFLYSTVQYSTLDLFVLFPSVLFCSESPGASQCRALYQGSIATRCNPQAAISSAVEAAN